MKKITSFILALLLILPMLMVNTGVPVSAQIGYLTVEYTTAHSDFQEAYESVTTDPSVVNLTVMGDGELTLEDCRYIKEDLTVLSINFTNATFENNKIPEKAFENFFTLVSIAMPLSLTEIEKEAFMNCIALKNAGMNAKLKTIGENAFYNCFSLESIALPDTVTRISENAFGGCDGLKSVIALNTNGSRYNAAENAFSGVPSKCALVIPANAERYDRTPFSQLTKTEWIFYALPESSMVAAGIDLELSADVTDIKNIKASYQWYRDGIELNNMTGDTLIIKNISQDYEGRYGVAVTINNIRAMFSCVIEVVGPTTGRTTLESKNKAPDHTIPVPEPQPSKYDTVKAVSLDEKELTDAFDITNVKKDQIIQLGFPNQPDEVTYLFYTKKLSEIYTQYKTGTFRISFNNGGYLDVPFDFIKCVHDNHLTNDKLLSITVTVKESNRYSAYFAIIDENRKELYDFKDTYILPGVYMYLPHENKDYMIGLETDRTYPVPSKKDGEFLKFAIRQGLIYSKQTPKPANFSDIKNHWGEQDIIKSAGNLIVEGYDGRYEPEGILTRAEFATMLVRVLYHNLTWDSNEQIIYSDVKDTDWFKANINLADIMGLTGFVTNKEFKPEQEITREEMAYMIARGVKYAGIDAAAAEIKYTDLNEISREYLNDVKICTNLKLLQGSGGYFKPKDGLTRAEAATVLNRLFNLICENV